MIARRAPAPFSFTLLVLLGLAASAASARAQTGGAPTGAAAPAAALPSPVDLIPLMDDSTHQALAAEAKAGQRRSEESLARSREREAEAKSQLEARRAAIDVTRKKIDLAGKEKRDSDKKALEAQKKNEEAARNFYERLLALREAETERDKAMIETWETAATMHTRATELLAQRRQHADVTAVTSSAQLSSRDTRLTTTEKNYVEAAKEWSEKAAESAAKEKTVAEKRAMAWESLKDLRR